MAGQLQRWQKCVEGISDSRRRFEWKLRDYGELAITLRDRTAMTISLGLQVVPERKMEALEQICPKYTSSLYSIELEGCSGRRLNIAPPAKNKLYVLLDSHSNERKTNFSIILQHKFAAGKHRTEMQGGQSTGFAGETRQERTNIVETIHIKRRTIIVRCSGRQEGNSEQRYFSSSQSERGKGVAEDGYQPEED